MAGDDRVSSGTSGLDRMLYGGIPVGNNFILQGPPGNEKDLIANQFVKDGLLNGEMVFVVLSTISPDEFRQQLKFIGINPGKYEGTGDLRIVDWYSYKNERVKSVEEEDGGSVIKASFDLTNVGIAITKTIEGMDRKRRKRAVINLLSPALNSFGMRTVYNFAQATRAKCRQENITSIFILDSEAHEAKVLSTLHQIFDGLIEVSRTREGPVLKREIIVLAMSGTSIMSEYKELEVEVNSISVKGLEDAGDTVLPETKSETGPSLEDIFKGFLESEQRAEAERATLAGSRAEAATAPEAEVAAVTGEEEGRDVGAAMEEAIYCPECNHEVPEESLLCPGCGAEFEEEGEMEVLQCPSCGGTVSDDDAVCPSCGISFDEEEERVTEEIIGDVLTAADEEEYLEEEGAEAEVWDDEPEMELGAEADAEEVVDPRRELKDILAPWRDKGYDLDFLDRAIEEDPKAARKEVMIYVSRARELEALDKRISRLRVPKLQKALARLKRDVTSPDRSKRGGIEWNILELRGRVKQAAKRKAARSKKGKVVKKRRRSKKRG